MLGRGFLLAVFLVLAADLWAGTDWTNGAGGGNWDDPGNWSNGLPDDANDTNLAVLIGQWLRETGYLAADLNESGGVNSGDFGVFAEGWKKETP